jgi:hypothetical protein
VSTSFVRLGKAGFWINDSVLELWLRFLALHIEDPVESGTPASRIRDNWLFASRGYCAGCVPVSLEEAVSTPEGKQLVQRAIRSLLQDLSHAPSHLNKDVLNLLGFLDGTWLGDFETRRLVEVGHAFLDLIDGKITTDASDSSFMPGSM